MIAFGLRTKVAPHTTQLFASRPDAQPGTPSRVGTEPVDGSHRWQHEQGFSVVGHSTSTSPRKSSNPPE